MGDFAQTIMAYAKGFNSGAICFGLVEKNVCNASGNIEAYLRST